MKLLVLLAALLLAGCSVEVAHETENKAQTESLSTFDNSKTTVAIGILDVPESSPETKQTDSATSSVQRSTTIVKVIVPEPTHEVVTPPPLIARCPEPTIRVTGSGNSVILGDGHHHHHKHFHIHQLPKTTPVRIDVRVELGDMFSDREQRRRMVERRIAKFFPHYSD